MKMKKSLPVLLMLICALDLSAQTPVITLSNPVTAGGTATYSSIKPRVAATTGNIPVVIWGKASATSNPGKISSSRWNGTGFSTPLQLNPAGVDVYAGPSEGPNIAASGDTVFVTYFSIPTNSSKIYIVRSTDGGVSFSDTVRADHQTTKPPYTPFVAIGQNGNPYLAYEASNTNMSAPEQLFSRSTDGGMSFTNEVNANIMAPGEPCECCPPSLVVKDSLVFLMYRNNVNNIRNIYVAVSQDHGATFPNIVQVDNTNWFINGCPSTGAEGVISGDSLVVTWRSSVSGQTRIYYNKIHIGTLQKGTVRKIDPAFTGTAYQDHPSITGANDTVAIVWDDNRTGNTNCYMITSVDGGTTFSAPVMINDTAAQTGTQRNPHAAYKNGVFHIVYQNSVTNEVIYRTAQITGMLGVAETNPKKATVTAAPNPFSNSTTIRFPGITAKAVKIELTNTAGRVVRVYENISASAVEIEKGSLPAGVYQAAVIFDNGERAAIKLVVAQ